MGSELTADLVLEGGGVKGIGLVGAMSVLEELPCEPGGGHFRRSHHWGACGRAILDGRAEVAHGDHRVHPLSRSERN